MPATPGNPGPRSVKGAIRRGRKFRQVLDGARAVFMADGYERGSMDEIARRAGVSKATLYSYFPDKRLLFEEVVRVVCRRQADAAIELSDSAAPPEAVLRAAARRLIDFYLSSFGQAMHRICAAEAVRFPELGRHFYESGPKLARARIGAYLEGACAAGWLTIEDVALAADQFVELSKADLFARMSCGLAGTIGPGCVERVIEGAVATFLARYRAA